MNKKESSIARNFTETPFIRFLNGTPLSPPNTIYESASTLLTEIKKASPNEVFHKLILYGAISGQRTVLPEATWFAVFKDFLNMFSREDLRVQHEYLQSLLIKLLNLMIEDNIEKSWNDLKKFIIEHVDVLSGWDKCWQKDDPLAQGVFRSEDGNYYVNDLETGVLCQVHGTQSLPEVHLNFIIKETFHSFGRIKKILDIFTLFAISKDFKFNSPTYPQSLRLYISEPNSGLASFRWHRDQFYHVRSTKWRPYCNFCDPDWLSEELIARLTEDITDNAWSKHVKKYSKKEVELDTDCPYQIDYVLDTNLKIGDDEEVYFTFEGKTFRWINSTPESKPILTLGFKETNNSKEAETSVNQLLSFLVWQHQIPIRKSYGVSGPRRNIPLTWGPRMTDGIKIDPQYLLSKYIKPNSLEKERALSFYKEGLNSESVFYKFFNFWKIIEVAISQKEARHNWIRTTALKLRLEKRRAEEISAQQDIAEYLDYHCRSAIAHVFRKPYIDPDKLEDNTRISKDVRLVEELARIAISTVNF